MRKISGFCILIAILFFGFKGKAWEDSTMYVHYINVGQATAVLLEFPCGAVLAVLIDVGAQDNIYHNKLIAYLTKFFERRSDLISTISLLMVTHPPIDHNEALKGIAQKFRVARNIDDVLLVGAERANQKWMEDQTGRAIFSMNLFHLKKLPKAAISRGNGFNH